MSPLKSLGWLVVLVAGLPALGMFMIPPDVPVDRLITNTQAWIKEHPQDASGYYTLGRIHYLALAMKTRQLKATANNTGGRPPDVSDMFNSPRNARPDPTLTAEDLAKHLTAALENFNKAIEMDGNNGLYHLGLASLLEAALTSGVKLEKLPGEAGDDPAVQYREKAITEYRKAYELTIDKDLALRNMPIQGVNALVSHEAGVRYAAMVEARTAKPEERDLLAKVKADVRRLEAKPMGAVTPIIFALDRPAALEELLDSGRTVRFNLDGTGRPQMYTWVRPDTAILVWDPRHTGSITSGHHLFGTVSFEIFWSDGYRALDALDDNRDGRLSGPELAGLALWFDRNTDGISQPGEVVPIEETDVRGIAVRATGRSGDSPSNVTGLELDPGRLLPTYDWVTRNLVGQ